MLRCQHGQALDTQPEVLDLLAYQFGRVLACDLAFHHLAHVIIVDPDDQLVVLDPLLPADPGGRSIQFGAGQDNGEQPGPMRVQVVSDLQDLLLPGRLVRFFTSATT
jgi:hypothetical protein